MLVSHSPQIVQTHHRMQRLCLLRHTDYDGTELATGFEKRSEVTIEDDARSHFEFDMEGQAERGAEQEHNSVK
jgi:hypothetical protein